MDRTPTRPRHRSFPIGHRSKAAAALSALIVLALTTLPTRPGFADDGGTTIYKYIDGDGNIVFTDHPTKGAEKIHVDPPPPIPLTPIEMPGQTPRSDRKQTSTDAPPQQPQDAPQPSVPQVQMKPPAPASAPPPAPEGSNPPPAAAGTMSPPPSAPTTAAAQNPPASTARAAENAPYRFLRVTSPRPGLQIAKPGGTIIVQLAVNPPLNAAVGDRFRITIDGDTMVDDSTAPRHMISGLKPGPHTLIAMVIRQVSNRAENLIESKPLRFELAKAPK